MTRKRKTLQERTLDSINGVRFPSRPKRKAKLVLEGELVLSLNLLGLYVPFRNEPGKYLQAMQNPGGLQGVDLTPLEGKLVRVTVEEV